MAGIDILTLGELLIDMFPDQIGKHINQVKKFIPTPGGAPANVAVAARRLGKITAFIGKLGADHFGIFLKNVLDEEGVITDGIRFDPDVRTTMAIIAMPDQDSAEFVFYRNPGADQMLTEDELNLELLHSTRVFHIGSVSLTDEPVRSTTYQAVNIAKESGALISYDVNYRPSLWKDPADALIQAQRMIEEIDLLKVNEIEAGLLTGGGTLEADDFHRVENTAKQLLSLGPEIVVITLGASGSYFQIANGGAFVPPFRVDAIDAVGCGDAFIGGLLVKLVSRQDWRSNLTISNMTENVRFANAVGALTSLNRGAIPALPYLAEVEEFLMEKG